MLRAAELRHYDRCEWLADAIVHIMGFVLGLAGCLALGAILPDAGLRRIAATTIYAVGLLSMLICSALYNLTPPHAPRKALLRRFDHAAIFLMIAGTYTPVALLAIGGGKGRSLLAGIWTVAAVGAALKLFRPGRFERLSVITYLLFGWSILLAFQPLLAAVPGQDVALLAAGGLLYSLGVVFHLWRRLRYHDAIWHALVLAAAGCHYRVILRLAASAD